MCGIVGYVGNDEKAVEVILEGLSKLEYRGYDSAGLAVVEDGQIFIEKKSGKLSNLADALENDHHHSKVGIGHTRWATHGVPTDNNAHPHLSNDGKVAVVHNGIIENFASLKEELIEKGYIFHSDTDTEVVAQLFSELYTGDLVETFYKLKERIRGSYAFGIIHKDHPGKIICARKESPLIIGLSKEKNFIASDVPAILKYTRDVMFLDNGEAALLEEGKVTVYNDKKEVIDKEITKIEWDMEQATKNGYPHFMIKEIEEQPAAVEKTLSSYIDIEGKINFGKSFENIDFDKIKEIHIVACGTAYYAGLQGSYFFKKINGLKTYIDIASEYRYNDPFVDENTLAIFLSQSGETLDTLMAMKLAKEKGATTLAVTNVLGSTISREADEVIYTLAGAEIAVASTKAYTTQAVTMYLMSLYFAMNSGKINNEECQKYLDDAYKLSENIGRVLETKEKIKAIAEKIKDRKNGFYLGRGIDDKIAKEGSLKMKEVSYVHTESFPAGELKHGPIALIEDGTMVVVVSTQDKMVEKVASNIKEVRARGAYVIAITKKDHKEVIDVADDVITIDDNGELLTPELAAIPMQLLAYYTAVGKGLDVDKPRNLAKSVTVE
ncbi:MAG: glutamine--fructose-6-phosphate transaminase (isomerizing) [Fusobacterium sp. JB021]|nr:glutamine--fructose-6-phosphate transaminase (isomerizing) [Fusobacterium sp. JB020]MDP0494210.1 glutamine--fructose-6-phosphate transaminase (isomerizing) [Fusobacterium sp. JB021]MDP0505695.1 glutamine--fructose-6-phosphate transaminase (isomerizing) [Fusobacterium sp. JB019]